MNPLCSLYTGSVACSDPYLPFVCSTFMSISNVLHKKAHKTNTNYTII